MFKSLTDSLSIINTFTERMLPIVCPLLPLAYAKQQENDQMWSDMPMTLSKNENKKTHRY